MLKPKLIPAFHSRKEDQKLAQGLLWGSLAWLLMSGGVEAVLGCVGLCWAVSVAPLVCAA